MYCPSCHVRTSQAQGFCKHCGAAALTGGDEAPHIGPYKLEAKLGEGGMGVVYRARDEKLNREVAVKVLHPQMLKQQSLRERFRREARMHAKIIHPNIVTLLSLYEDGEHMALVMEMVHGKNLKEYLRQNPRPVLLDVIRIAEAVCSGLEAAHKLGVVHRDLKPANILLAADGAIKLMDFGLAKPKQGGDDLTQSGATVGSFRYMAPEQILNQPIDARTDLYALGILMYQMTTGKLPFNASAGGEFEILEKQVRHDPDSPRKLNVALPAAMSDLILALLAKDPDKRPASCEAVHKILRGIAMRAEPPRAKGVYSRHLFTKIRAPGIPYRWIKEKLRPLPAGYFNLSDRFQTPFVWGMIIILISGLGWGLTRLIRMPERASPVPEVNLRAVRPATSVASGKKAGQTVKKAQMKAPAEKSAKRKAIVRRGKASGATRSSARSVTYHVSHRLLRSDGGKAGGGKHEFRGGTRVYFKSLADYPLKDKIRMFRSGWIRLYLKKPVKLSRIVIHRASVGRRTFKGGEIKLEVEDSRGHWRTLLDRKDRDIDRPLSIRKPRKALAHVKGVRFKFKTSEPITIGPIDLLP